VRDALSILLLAPGRGIAGSTQSVLNLAQALRDRGHRVVLGRAAGGRLDGLATEAGFSRPPLDFGSTRALVATLRPLLEQASIDVVNSQDSVDRRACTWLRWRGRLPMAFVVTRRTMPLTSYPELVAVGRTADRTIAVSGAVARALMARGYPPGGLEVVPNGIVLERVDAPHPEAAVHPLWARVGALDGRAMVLCVARRKDQHILLRALAAVSTPVHAVFAGVGPDGVLGRLAERLPPRHRAVFLGAVESPLPLYRRAALAVLPSRIEGLSQALLEAMALGVPVVASEAGGNPDLVTHDVTGWLVPPLDVRAWAARLEAALGDRGARLRVAEAARRHVRDGFTLARTAARTEAVYRAALATRP
jgi:glycosyltransferase involved in cell wall biosynthesis